MRSVDIADETRPRRPAPGCARGQFEHLEQVARRELRQCLGAGVLGGAKRRGGGDEMCDRRGIMRREDAIGEADIGEIAAGSVGTRVDQDRPAG